MGSFGSLPFLESLKGRNARWDLLKLQTGRSSTRRRKTSPRCRGVAEATPSSSSWFITWAFRTGRASGFTAAATEATTTSSSMGRSISLQIRRRQSSGTAAEACRAAEDTAFTGSAPTPTPSESSAPASTRRTSAMLPGTAASGISPRRRRSPSSIWFPS